MEQAKQFTNKLQPIANLLNKRLALPGGNSSPTLGSPSAATTRTWRPDHDRQPVRRQLFKAGSFDLGTLNSMRTYVTTVASGALGSQSFAGQVGKLRKYLDVLLDRRDQGVQDRDELRQHRPVSAGPGLYSISTGRLNQYLGTYPVGPIPVSLNLVGSMNLKLGGSIVYGITGLPRTMIRGLRLENAWAARSVPVAIEASVGVGTFTVLGQRLRRRRRRRRGQGGRHRQHRQRAARQRPERRLQHQRQRPARLPALPVRHLPGGVLEQHLRQRHPLEARESNVFDGSLPM